MNDIAGTVVREKIYHAVGAHTPQGMTLPQLPGLIRGAGKVPAERDSFYRVLHEFAPDETGALEGSTAPLAGLRVKRRPVRAGPA